MKILVYIRRCIFLLSFLLGNIFVSYAQDADGGMNTIRLVPAPAATEVSQTVAYDKTKMLEREITVGAEGFQLPGILTLPKSATEPGANKVPCAILVHGSDPNDRDETTRCVLSN